MEESCEKSKGYWQVLGQSSNILVCVPHRMVVVPAFAELASAHHCTEHTPAQAIFDLLHGVVGLKPERARQLLASFLAQVCANLNGSQEKLPLIGSTCRRKLWGQIYNASIAVSIGTCDVQMGAVDLLKDATFRLSAMRPSGEHRLRPVKPVADDGQRIPCCICSLSLFRPNSIAWTSMCLIGGEDARHTRGRDARSPGRDAFWT